MRIEVKTAIDHIHSLLRDFRCTREVERLDYPTQVVVTIYPPWICPTLLKVQFTFSRKRSKEWECAVVGLSKKMVTALQHHKPTVDRQKARPPSASEDKNSCLVANEPAGLFSERLRSAMKDLQRKAGTNSRHSFNR